jgi:hypothetical protein
LKLIGLKMKNTIIQMSVALLLFFGIATSSQATFIHGDKAAGHYTGGGWGSLNSSPLARQRNFRPTYSATTGVHGLKLYFAWKLQKQGDAEVIPLAVGGDKPNGNRPIPEPSIIALFGLGLFGLGLARRRIRK